MNTSHKLYTWPAETLCANGLLHWQMRAIQISQTTHWWEISWGLLYSYKAILCISTQKQLPVSSAGFTPRKNMHRITALILSVLSVARLRPHTQSLLFLQQYFLSPTLNLQEINSCIVICFKHFILSFHICTQGSLLSVKQIYTISIV